MTSQPLLPAAAVLKPQEGFKVICAGLGRTGTLSLSEALTTLGYNPTHYVEFHQIDHWVELAETKNADDRQVACKNVANVITQDGFDAIMDNPACDIYQDLLRLYPNAKVILTVRDNPKKFVKSWKLLFDTMIITETKFSWNFPCLLGYLSPFKKLKKIRYFMGTTHLGLQPGEFTHDWRNKPNADEWLAEQYERHNKHVQDNVPKEQLLVFNVKEGWRPLCEFLGKPIPGVPFPHSQSNSAEGLMKLQKVFRTIVYASIPVLVVVLGTGIALARGSYNATKKLLGN